MDQTAHTQNSQGFSGMLEFYHSTLIYAEPERVFIALTTSEGLDAWFTSGALVNAHSGGEIIFRWVNWGPHQITTEDGGSILEIIPPRRFVFQWHPDLPSMRPPSR